MPQVQLKKEKNKRKKRKSLKCVLKQGKKRKMGVQERATMAWPGKADPG